MRLPLFDWQFYVVTLLGLGALWLIVRPFVPRKRKTAGCHGCSLGPVPARRRRTALTLRGRRI
jgi:hypothetical protein